MIVKTIICDDNENSRYILNEFIKRINRKEILVIGEASNGNELIKLCQNNKPNLILLDIDMPGINGIETAKQIIKFSPDMFFIFTTAYPSFSIQCFEVHPFDFLLKPISIERLEKSLDSLISKLSKNSDVDSDSIISFGSGHNSLLMKQKDILFVERTGRKLLIHTRTKQIEVYSSLKKLQDELDPQTFIRSHNSYLINKHAIKKIKRDIGTCYEVTFNNYNNSAYISRRNLVIFEDLPFINSY